MKIAIDCTGRVSHSPEPSPHRVNPTSRALVVLGNLAFLIMFSICVCASGRTCHGQALDMDGQSGIFLQPTAGVVSGRAGAFSHPVIGFHTVNVSPVYGTLYHAHIEEGYGNWLEFGYTRSNHTDGSSPLVNYEGMNIFNLKVKLIGDHGIAGRWAAWMPEVAVGGVLRTNIPYINQAESNGTLSDGDIYAVATKIVAASKHLWFLANAGVRGTNAQVYGLVGNATSWSARAFGTVGFPIPIKNKMYIAPAFEIDQEPHDVKYLPGLRIPSTLAYAIRVAPLDGRWNIDMGTGHIVGTATPGVDFKANNTIAVAVNYRFCATLHAGVG